MAHSISAAAAVVLLASTFDVFAQEEIARAMSNNIGLLAHCEGLRFISSEQALTAQTRIRTALNAINGSTATVAGAEAAGRNGLWGSSAMPIHDRATLAGQSVEEFCLELIEGF